MSRRQLLRALGLTIAAGLAPLVVGCRPPTPPTGSTPGTGGAGPTVAAPPAPTTAQDSPTYWNPRIAIVWPHGSGNNATPLEQSSWVNISVWPTGPADCQQPPTLPATLYVARNNDPVEPVPVQPRWIVRDDGGSRFPSLEYDSIPADLVADPHARFSFVAGLASNVWVHGVDPRTVERNPVLPRGFADGTPEQVDPRIQVVWPHDEHGKPIPAEMAHQVNIAVDIFAHRTMNSVRPSAALGEVALLVATGNEPIKFYPSSDQPMKSVQTTYSASGQTYPRWVFNNVPVAPGTTYHFAAMVLGSVQSFPNLWTHGGDGRTNLPRPPSPPACR
ncbi:MAG TPA: hypothetical protein VFZ25_07890 [Chloroflexota bacterium]|nr:hypothetical protein [Chloroflexota bacterium]